MVAIALAVAASVACQSAPPAPVQFAEYRYIATYPPGPFSSSDPFHVTWTPRQAGRSSVTYAIRLCVALVGPYASVDAPKQASPNLGRPQCPPVGSTVASATLPTRSDTGGQIEAGLTLPNVPGFYNVLQVSLTGSDSAPNATSASGIIEVRGR